MQRRQLLQLGGALAATTALTGLSGCSTLGTLSSEVTRFGAWPAGRAPGSYAFDRLLSQQARAAESAVLEDAARGALAKAGFKPAAAGQAPDVLVQLGAQDIGIELPLWDDPLWWHGGFSPWRRSLWPSPRLAYAHRPLVLNGHGRFDRYTRQVAVLLRDRATGQPLFEARAVSEGVTPARPGILAAMFEAALTGFPQAHAEPQTVDVLMSR